MNGADMVWPVPVIAGPGTTRQMLTIALNDVGEVLLQVARGPAVLLPATSDDQLCEAIRDARKVGQQM